MGVQYVIDEDGSRTAVVVPIEEWEALRVRNLEFAEDVPPEAIQEATQALAELAADPSLARPVEEVMRDFDCRPEK
jgi:hypothetical protein